MKVKLIHTEQDQEPTVTLTGHPQNVEFQKWEALLKTGIRFVLGQQHHRQFKLSLSAIYYVESQQNRTLLFTKDDSFSIHERLYEIETWGDPFVRINKSTIVNLQYLKSFKPLFNSKLEANLDNGDRLEVSRLYIPMLKKKIGG